MRAYCWMVGGCWKSPAMPVRTPAPAAKYALRPWGTTAAKVDSDKDALMHPSTTHLRHDSGTIISGRKQIGCRFARASCHFAISNVHCVVIGKVAALTPCPQIVVGAVLWLMIEMRDRQYDARAGDRMRISVLRAAIGIERRSFAAIAGAY